MIWKRKKKRDMSSAYRTLTLLYLNNKPKRPATVGEICWAIHEQIFTFFTISTTTAEARADLQKELKNMVSEGILKVTKFVNRFGRIESKYYLDKELKKEELEKVTANLREIVREYYDDVRR